MTKIGNVNDMLRPMRVTSSGIQLRLDFWVAALLVGACGGLGSAILWAGTIFVSILIHELARTLVGRSLGYRGTTVLTALGAHAQFEPPPARGPSALLALTGPVASAACGLALVCLKHFVAHPEAHWLVVGVSFNFAWAAINLLPITGLGGDLKGVATAAMNHRGALGAPDLRRVADILIEAGESELAVGVLQSSLGLSSLESACLKERASQDPHIFRGAT